MGAHPASLRIVDRHGPVPEGRPESGLPHRRERARADADHRGSRREPDQVVQRYEGQSRELDQIDERYLGFAAAGRALGDRQIDVYCSAGVPYTIPALTEISLRKPVRYISLTDEEQKKIVAKHKFYAPATIPIQKEVNGMDAPAKTIGYDVWWIVSKKVSDQAVYDMLKTVADPENLKALSAAAGYWKSLSGKFDALEEHKIYVHPAAAKYWRERGQKVPDEVVKGYGSS
jgi:TRAP transporter TAXI family solute receptor